MCSSDLAEASAAAASAALHAEEQARQAAEDQVASLRERLDGVEKELAASCAALLAEVCGREKDAEAASGRRLELEAPLPPLLELGAG